MIKYNECEGCKQKDEWIKTLLSGYKCVCGQCETPTTIELLNEMICDSVKGKKELRNKIEGLEKENKRLNGRIKILAHDKYGADERYG